MKGTDTDSSGERHELPAACPECGYLLDASKFGVRAVHCPQCGQKLAVGKLDFRDVASEMLSGLANFDLPILRTTFDLLRGPGRVANHWIEGKRKTYVHPMKFIIVMGVFVALLYEPIHQWQVSRQVDGVAIYDTGLAHYASKYFALFCLVLVIPLALLFKLLTAKLSKRRTFLEWYSLGLYAYGLGALLQLLLSVVLLLLPGHQVSAFTIILESLLPILLLAWGTWGFVEPAERWTGVWLAFLVQGVFVFLTAGLFA